MSPYGGGGGLNGGGGGSPLPPHPHPPRGQRASTPSSPSFLYGGGIAAHTLPYDLSASHQTKPLKGLSLKVSVGVVADFGGNVL